MKKYSRFLFVSFFILVYSSSFGQYFWVPDPVFRFRLKVEHPTCFTPNDSLILNCPGILNDTLLDFHNLNLASVSGVEHFQSLKYLYLYTNSIYYIDTLPASLQYLDIRANYINSLKCLPQNLKTLICMGNWLFSIDTLPASLERLHAAYNPVSNIHKLPPHLKFLDVSNCTLTSIDSLPTSLEKLFAGNNHLTALPNLPAGLLTLYCQNNLLTNLPPLPNSLFDLNCSNNSINDLGILPLDLGILNCQNTHIHSLPNLPDFLSILNCADNPLSCLPPLPASFTYLNYDSTYIACIPNLPPGFTTTSTLSCFPSPLPICTFQNDYCNYNHTYGNVFIDSNSNSYPDSGEIGVSTIVHTYNGAAALADSSGFFTLLSDTGMLTAFIDLPSYFLNTTPLQQSISVIPNHSDTLYFGIRPIAQAQDLAIEISSFMVVRPGFKVSYKLEYKNSGTLPVATYTVKYKPASVLTNLYSIPPATSLSGDTLIWLFSNILPQQIGNILLYDSVSSAAQLGNYAVASAWIEPISGDTAPQNNAFFDRQLIIGSYDPNDKLVSPEQIDSTYNTYLDYFIQFQNTGTDTAFNVFITDTLSPLLDYSTILPGISSHNYSFSLYNGIAQWYFSNILLPDSNVSEARSHGFLKFKVKPLPFANTGFQIKNKASIYFDYNAPVITDAAIVDITPLLVAINNRDAFSIFPIPADKELQLLRSDNQSIGIINLLDISGKTLLTLNCQSNSCTICMNEIPKGFYILKGSGWTKKIVKS